MKNRIISINYQPGEDDRPQETTVFYGTYKKIREYTLIGNHVSVFTELMYKRSAGCMDYIAKHKDLLSVDSDEIPQEFIKDKE